MSGFWSGALSSAVVGTILLAVGLALSRYGVHRRLEARGQALALTKQQRKLQKKVAYARHLHRLRTDPLYRWAYTSDAGMALIASAFSGITIMIMPLVFGFDTFSKIIFGLGGVLVQGVILWRFAQMRKETFAASRHSDELYGRYL